MAYGHADMQPTFDHHLASFWIATIPLSHFTIVSPPVTDEFVETPMVQFALTTWRTPLIHRGQLECYAQKESAEITFGAPLLPLHPFATVSSSLFGLNFPLAGSQCFMFHGESWWNPHFQWQTIFELLQFAGSLSKFMSASQNATVFVSFCFYLPS